jgi:MFS family permease
LWLLQFPRHPCHNLQVPLYGTYAKIAGFGSGISAIAFSTYVAGLLPTLILLGGISDRVGRKK